MSQTFTFMCDCEIKFNFKQKINLAIFWFQDSGGAVVDDMNSTMSNNQEIFGFGNHQTTQGAYGGTYGNTSPTNIEILKNTGRIKIK